MIVGCVGIMRDQWNNNVPLLERYPDRIEERSTAAVERSNLNRNSRSIDCIALVRQSSSWRRSNAGRKIDCEVHDGKRRKLNRMDQPVTAERAESNKFAIREHMRRHKDSDLETARREKWMDRIVVESSWNSVAAEEATRKPIKETTDIKPTITRCPYPSPQSGACE